MNKSELIDALADRLGVGKREAQTAVDAVLDTITRAVVTGEKVAITGFGIFEKVERGARVARNPRTGATVRVRKTSVPKFRPGAELKAFVSGAKKLAKSAPARVAAPVKATASAAKATPAKSATSARKATTAKRSTATKSAAKRGTTKAAAPARKTSATKSAPAKRVTARKAAPATSTAKKTSARKTATRRTAKKA